MKYFTGLFITLFSLSALYGQNEYKVQQSTGTLVLAEVSDVEVVAYDGNEVIIETDNYDDEVDERAQGLQMVNSLGLIDNSKMGLSVQKEDGNVVITQISTSCDASFSIKVPQGMGIDFSHSSLNGDHVKIVGVSKEIVVSSTHGDVELENITGPMAVKSVYGSIEADFNAVSQDGSITLESVYDFVDVSIPASAKADISLYTPYGEIYSDVDIEIASKGGMKRISSKSVKGTINGGGVDFNIKASYENVYLRKK